MQCIKFPILLLTLAFFQGEVDAKERRPIAYVKKAPIATPAQMEQEIFHLINKKRVADSLSPLVWSDVIAEQARKHSVNMANKIVAFSHEGSDLRFKALTKSIPSLRLFGENVAYNQGYSKPAETAVSGWLDSPGHYENIMGDFNLTGVGVEKNSEGKYYLTQLFVKTASSKRHK